MQAYKTIATKENHPNKVAWHGSQVEAARARKLAKAEGYAAETTPISIPTGKQELLQFLNDNQN